MLPLMLSNFRKWILPCAAIVALALLFVALGLHSRLLWERYGDVVIIENKANQPISHLSRKRCSNHTVESRVRVSEDGQKLSGQL